MTTENIYQYSYGLELSSRGRNDYFHSSRFCRLPLAFLVYCVLPRLLVLLLSFIYLISKFPLLLRVRNLSYATYMHTEIHPLYFY